MLIEVKISEKINVGCRGLYNNIFNIISVFLSSQAIGFDIDSLELLREIKNIKKMRRGSMSLVIFREDGGNCILGDIGIDCIKNACDEVRFDIKNMIQ